MKNRTIGIVIAFLFIVACPSTLLADVDWEIIPSLSLEKAPVDMKISQSGEWLYVLTDSGELLVYTAGGELEGEIKVGKEVDQIEPTKDDEVLFLRSRKNRTVNRLELSFVREINTTGSPFKGAEDAPVVIVDYTDFQCPYCSQLVPLFDQLLELYPGKVKIVYKSYPLRNHAFAYKAALVAMAAQKEGKFWEVHDRFFENYNQMSDEKIMEIRKEFGLDSPEFDQSINSTEVRNKVRSDAMEGQRIGVRGTPTVFVNGKRLKDKRIDGFKAAIEKELEKRQTQANSK